MKYLVNITAITYYKTVVEAEDENRAESIARRRFEDNALNSEWPDCEVEFEVEEL